MLDAFYAALSAADSWPATIIGDTPRIFIWGLLAGAAAMGIYLLASNQVAISQCKQDAREARRRLFDPDLSGADFAALQKRNMRLAFRLLGMVIGPALLSALPPLAVALWMEALHGQVSLISWLPAWAGGWEAVFFSGVLAAAVAAKYGLRIE